MTVRPTKERPGDRAVFPQPPPVVAVGAGSPYLELIRDQLGVGNHVVDLLGGEALPAGQLVVVLAPWTLRSSRAQAVPAAIERADWVHFVSAGVDGFPLERLAGRLVTCGRGANSVAIAELTVGLLLAVEKRMPRIWEAETNEPFIAEPLGTLAGRTVGLVGFGSIGQEVARRLAGFGSRVVAFRRSGRPAELSTVEIAPSLPQLLAEVDHLVVAAPLTAQTDRLLNDEAFAVIKPGVHLVNVARGRLVDTDALVRALAAGIVARASLDVTEPEPLPASHPLRSDPRVWLLPHLSWSAPGGLGRGVETFVDNLRRWESGKPLEGVVDPVLGY